MENKTNHAPADNDESTPLLLFRLQSSTAVLGNDTDTTVLSKRIVSVKIFCIILTASVFCFFFKTTMQTTHKTLLLPRRQQFPDNFVWGVATSSYQIEGAAHEGGRGLSIWDTFCEKEGEIADGSNGDVACDHYHRFKEDVQLMKTLNIKAYRFSISWPRILPNGNNMEINPEGLAFYNALIDELLLHDIEPWITLYHWDLPQALEDEYGGWLSRKIVDDFGRYASICFQSFGDRVKRWITINEPWTVAVQAYSDGTKAPGRLGNPQVEVYVAAHHLLLAHARAAKIYKQIFAFQKGTIGISNCGDFRYPLNPESQDDRDAAERAMVFQYAWFTDPLVLGDYPKEMRERIGNRLPTFSKAERLEMIGSLDFQGLNHYSTLYASSNREESKVGGYWTDMDVEFSSDPKWRKNLMVRFALSPTDNRS
jgi:beta-glucosidase/6-phospho-beta-glucosidase/beta-galactosidase